MTFSKTLILGLAALSFTACQTTSGYSSPSEVLLADVPTAASTSTTVTALSASNPTCLKFYENTATFAALPVDELSPPSGPSFGGSLLKTVVLGTLAGVTGGGVAALGIESSFAEAALITTASQVTYNAGDSVYDSIVGKDPVETEIPEVPALTPMQEIEKAAAALGCPAPDQASIAALKLSEAAK